MSEVRSTIAVDMVGNLQDKARRFGNSMEDLSNRGVRSLSRLSPAARQVSRGLDAVGNKYTALLTGAAGVGTYRMVTGLQTRFTRLGIQANASATTIEHLKEKIYEAARAPEIRLDPAGIVDAVDEIVERTGDLRFAEANIRNIGLAMSATGAEGRDIGGIMSEFQKMGIIKPKEVLEALDILNVQGKEGAFTLQNLANLGPRVFAAYTATGRGGLQAVRELGATLQVVRQGTGNPEQAATAFEAVMRTMADKQKINKLAKGGIQVFDPKALKEGKEILRPINDLMVDIITKAKGNQTVLSKVFDAEAIRAFNAMASEYKRTGSVASLQKFMNLQANGTVTVKDSATAAADAARSVTALATAWERFAESNLTKAIQSAADALNSINPETLDKVLKVGTGMAVGLGGLVIANKARRLFGFGGKGGAAGGGMLGGSGPIPVYVVNKHLSMLPGSDGFGLGGGQGSAAGRSAGMLRKYGAKLLGLGGTSVGALGATGAAGMATSAAMVGVTGGAGYGLGMLINKYLLQGTKTQDKIGEAIARLAAIVGSQEAKVAIEVNSSDGTRAKVKRMSAAGMQVDVDTGVTMAGAY
ncbi:MAG: hypothetical protein OEV73_00075 [Desulfobulbaceae bacterium]|nr:hypothetical protein [Desulfobulbaceae bacterium]